MSEQPERVAVTVYVSPEVAADAAGLQQTIIDLLNPTAASERRYREAQAAAKAERAEERRQAEPVELTLDGLLDALQWPREYAEHFVQPYCACGWGFEQWDICQHAYDLGIPLP